MSKANLLLAAAVLATAGAAQPSMAQPPMPMRTRDFVQTAAASDHYEILAGQVAVVESQNPQVRAFAQQMIQDHTRISQALRQATTASGMPPPPISLSDDGQKFLAQLQSLKGPDFDRAYVRQQVLAHQQALVVEQGYAAGGSDPNVRQAAQSAVPVIQHHLQTAQQMRSIIGGS